MSRYIGWHEIAQYETVVLGVLYRARLYSIARLENYSVYCSVGDYRLVGEVLAAFEENERVCIVVGLWEAEFEGCFLLDQDEIDLIPRSKFHITRVRDFFGLDV